MFRSLWSRALFAPSSSVRKRPRASRRLPLQLETLEDRITPSTIINVTDPSGGMDQAANVTLSTINTANKITLRDAINLADNTGGSGSYLINLPAGNTIDFTSPVNNTTITSNNTVQNQNWYGPNALPAITSNITIEGNGDTLEVATGVNMRFFYVSGGPTLTGGALTLGTLELDNLTLEGGVAQGGNGGGGGLGAGGAIFNQGNLTLNGDTLTNNKAIGGNGGNGGGGGIGSNADGVGDGGGFGGDFSITGGPTGGAGNSSGGGGGAGFQQTDNAAAAAGGGRGGFGGSGGGGGGAAGDGGGGGSHEISVSGGGGGGFGDGGNASSINGGGGGGGGIGGGGGVGIGGGGGGGGFGGGGGRGSGNGGGGDGGFGGGGGGFGGLGGFGGFGGGNGGGLFTADNGFDPIGGGGGGMGGGIFSMFGSLTLINSTLSGNTAQGGNGGGGTSTGGSGFGGAIFNLDGNATLTYVTVANNNAINGTSGTTPAGNGNANGGGVYNLAFGNTITTGAANTATLTLLNSIIGQNNGGNNLVNDGENGKNTNTAQINGSSSVVQGGATQTGNGTNSVATGAITVTVTPNLATSLANNGGLTQTLVPLNGSLVIGAGNSGLNSLPNVDQRGLTRPNSTSTIKPDDGAFQTQTTVTNVTNVTTTYTSAGQTITLTANVDAFGQPVTEGQVQFTVAGLGPVVATINDGTPGVASVALTLPGTVNPGSYTIVASYTDPNNPSLFNSSTGSGTLTVASPNTGSATTTTPTAPIGSLSMFAFGFGPTGIDLFEVDSRGDVFAQSFSGGGLVLVNTTLHLPLAELSNGSLLALLSGDDGQNYIVDIFNPFLPLVEPAVLAALHL